MSGNIKAQQTSSFTSFELQSRDPRFIMSDEETVITIGKSKKPHKDDHHGSQDSLRDLMADNWSLTFRDGRRSIDFVLVFDKHEKNKLNAAKRLVFEQNLVHQGLELEYENAFSGRKKSSAGDGDENGVDELAQSGSGSGSGASLAYVKVHAPLEVLQRYAEGLKMLLPVRPRIDEFIRKGKNIRATDCRELLAEYGVLFNESSMIDSVHAEEVVQRSVATPVDAAAPDLAQPRDDWRSRMFEKLKMYPDVKPVTYRTAVQYTKNREYLFDRSESLFKQKDRSYIVDYILQRESYVHVASEKGEDQQQHESQPMTSESATSSDKKQPNAFGITRLLADDVYTAAFPLHDCPLDIEDEAEQLTRFNNSLRHQLWRQWARWGMAFKLQPLSHIQLYFGDTIAFYFAWLGFYTGWLAPLMLIGFVIFIYGLIVAFTDSITTELCASNSTMCPLCITGCPYWTMSNQCMNLIISRVWENELTFVWGVVVTLWCTLFIEFWKRREGMLRFEWNLFKLEHDDDPPRPEYAALVQNALIDPNSKIKVKVDIVTGKEEPDVPYWRIKVPHMIGSWVVVFIAMLMVLVSVVGTIFYRVALLTFFYRTNNFWLVTFGSTIASITGACISLVFIMVLGFIYDRVAIWLTDREYWRTQSEYDNALMMKQTLFQFVNYYGSVFYVAFFKGNFGTVGEYAFAVTQNPQSAGDESLDFGIEICPSGSCIPDLTIQLAIVMVGKQLVYGNLMELLLPKVMKFVMGWLKKDDSDNKVAEIHKNSALFCNYDMGVNGPRPLFSEYLEMVIQFGFLSIFAIAFPFAPLFAFINNIVEIRLDAMKFLKENRRVVATFETGIGTWLTLLYAISRIAVLSNGALIAFTSDLIPRLLFDNAYKSKMSYENFTMSYLNTTILGETNRTAVGKNSRPIDPPFCLYNDFRNPPWSVGDELPYDQSKLYWIVLAYRFITFAAFENVILCVTALVAYVIPDVPQATEDQIRRERYFARQLTIKMEEQFSKRRHASKKRPLGATASDVPSVIIASAAATPERSNKVMESPYYDLPAVEKSSVTSKRRGRMSAMEMSPVSNVRHEDEDDSSTTPSHF